LLLSREINVATPRAVGKSKTKNTQKKNRTTTNYENDPAEKRARRLWLKTLCTRLLSSNNLAAY